MKRAVVIPEIKYPFPGAISKHAKEANLITYNWSVSQKILDPLRLKNYDKQKVGYLAARVHPTGDLEDIVLTSDFSLLFSMLDDYSDKVKNEMEFKLYIEELLSIFQRGYTNSNDTLLSAWSDWWRRLKKVTIATWRERFIFDATKCFYTMIWEVGYRENNSSPSLQEYRIERQFTVNNLMFDLAEKSNQNYVPNKIRDEKFYNTVESANKIVNWANDLVSLNKELEDGDAHNLVLRIQVENNLTLNQAIDKVYQMHNEEIVNYTRFEQELLDTNNEFQHELKHFTFGLRNCITGFLGWSEESSRYKTSNVKEKIN
ncbi:MULTISPECIES: terpene synthase family protein [Bacillaceae]|uniref:Terpene synthase n=1 Tax=Alkalicoccobacillus plakortidis TaxID=444060 RepID=A0A9D5I1V0_9BACI|nr:MULTISPECIES: hypothetical protein [Bacillaceae]KQL58057.1 hypothetical protein AN965_07035 [Alkalicoccobacillus plakortidis]